MEEKNEPLTFIQKLFAIQNELTALAKTKENKFLKDAKYFDINQVIAHLKPLLEKHKILVMQPLCVIGGKSGIQTIIRDTESDNFESFEAIYPDVPDAQRAGSSITYFRRYSLVSFFLLESEDDDGTKAGKKDKPIDVVPLLEKLAACKNMEDLKKVWKGFKPKERENADLVEACGKMKKKFSTV